LLSELYFANHIELIFIFFTFILLLAWFAHGRTANIPINQFTTPIQGEVLLRQSTANSSLGLKSPLYLLIILPLILPILISQIRNLYLLLYHQLPVGSLTPDAQFAIGFANHILLSKDVSSFNIDGITTPYYTGVLSTLATFNFLSPINNEFDLIIFSWLSSIALVLALFRLGKIMFPGITKLIILFAALSPFSLSAWPFTKKSNDVGAQSIGLLEVVPSTTLAIYLFVSSLIKLVELQKSHRLVRNQISPLMAILKTAPLGVNVLAISCLKPSVGYVVLTFFFIYGVLTGLDNGMNILSYSCLLLSASLLASISFIFPFTEGISFSLLSNSRLFFSPFTVITYTSMLIALFLKSQLYKRNSVMIALQVNAVIWGLFVMNSQFTAPGRNTIYGLIPLAVSAILPLCSLGIIVVVASSLNYFNSLPNILYLYLCSALFYWFFEFFQPNSSLLYSPDNRRLILLSSFILLLLLVILISSFKDRRIVLGDIQFRSFLHLCFLVLITLGTSNFKNNYAILDFRSDEVRSRPEYISTYREREKELREIAKILEMKKISEYATNSWCRYLPNALLHFTFDPYGCDTRAYEVSSSVFGTPRLGGWAYDYKYGRNQANDDYIEEQIDLYKRLWNTQDVSKFWRELGVSALILERGMPIPKVNITKIVQFQGRYFTLYIKK